MSKITHVNGSEKSEAAKIIQRLGYKHNKWQVFQDFVAIYAIEFSSCLDALTREDRQAEKIKICSRYSKEEIEALVQCFNLLVTALENEPRDFLGSLYMSLELGNAWKGQFFTPDSVCQLMAEITIGDQAEKAIRKWGFFSLNDPCVGGGAMIIGAATALKTRDINYQQSMHVFAMDIDITAVHMTYLQLSLLHIPAVVLHGNALSCETWSAWYTPAHIVGGWSQKLRFRQAAEAMQNLIAREPAPENNMQIDPEKAEIHEPQIYIPSDSVNVREQMDLF